MTDSEKIAAIIADKHLTNAQFCQTCGLQPATLSHITSGRSNPSLAILRSINQGFPDINPLWLFTDEGDMYGSPTPSTIPSPATTPSTSAESPAPTIGPAPQPSESNPQEDPFASTASPATGGTSQTRGGLIGAEPQNQSTTASNSSIFVEQAQGAPVSTPAMNSQPELLPSTATLQASTASVTPQIPVIVHEPPQRRNIVEIRVFYDDNTFEILTRKG